MACELTVLLENRPGSFAALGEALGNDQINIEGICGFTWEDKYLIHLLVKNSGTARTALENAGINVPGERDVLIIDIEDRPGQFGRLCRQLAIAGINPNLVYLTTKSRLVLGVDDFNKARAVLDLLPDELRDTNSDPGGKQT
ncbi:MAG: amino acid-binding ACT domain-containing protein [Anaerolineaceae bacterium]